MSTCPACSDGMLRAIAEALSVDDLDRALTLGLLDAQAEIMAENCSECTARAGLVIAARQSRQHALAARERYRARDARLAERTEARARKRELAAPKQVTGSTSASAPLPPAAAAALARAKARAAAKRPTE